MEIKNKEERMKGMKRRYELMDLNKKITNDMQYRQNNRKEKKTIKL